MRKHPINTTPSAPCHSKPQLEALLEMTPEQLEAEYASISKPKIVVRDFRECFTNDDLKELRVLTEALVARRRRKLAAQWVLGAVLVLLLVLGAYYYGRLHAVLKQGANQPSTVLNPSSPNQFPEYFQHLLSVRSFVEESINGSFVRGLLRCGKVEGGDANGFAGKNPASFKIEAFSQRPNKFKHLGSCGCQCDGLIRNAGCELVLKQKYPHVQNEFFLLGSLIHAA